MGTFDSYDDLANGVVHTTYELAEKSKHNPVDVPHLFFVLINQANNAILDLLKQGGADLTLIRETTKKSLTGLLSVQDQFSISQELNDIFLNAVTISKNMGDKKVSVYTIFLALLQSNTITSKMLQEQGITLEKMQSIIAQMPKAKLHADDQTISLHHLASDGEVVNQYGEDLTQLAQEGKLNDVIGREKDLKKVIEILCRKEKNNAVILGDSGVGKTAIVELLAQKIVTGEVPELLKDKKILRVNLGEIIAGTKFRGEFEEKISGIINTVKASQGKIILFIDEFHNVAGAGKAEGSMGLSEILKPELSSGNIQIIGATTTNEYRLSIEKDTALTRRLESVMIQEPTVQDTITILRGIEGKFEEHHGVTINDSTLIAAVELSDRYIKDRKLPDKAINMLDQAATKVKIMMTSMPEDISDMMIKIGQLIREKNSMIKEVSSIKDTILKETSEKKIKDIEQQIITLQTSYNNQKNSREQIKTLFDENKKYEGVIQGMEKQAKECEKNAEFDKVAKIKYSDIVDIQKKIAMNKEQIITMQNRAGIIIKDTVEREDIAQVISEKTGIPLTKMMEEESKRLAKLEDYLGTKVIGQKEAIAAISNAIRRARVGLKDPKKPIGSFMFLGPTGVGKTELAKTLAEFLFGDKKAIVRLNMSEYKEEHSTAKLIGSPPGYVGYEQGGQLTEAIKRKPYSVILLDEVEKAHQSVFDLFLQIFDDGMLNDSLGNTIDFKNTIIIMTSNIGSREIMERLQGSVQTIGDLYPVESTIAEDNDTIKTNKKKHRSHKKHHDTSIQIEQREKLQEELQPMLMDFFRPELLNRLDENIIFNPISPEMLKNILDIKIKEQSELVYTSNNIMLEFSNQAKNFLAKKGRDPANGARPINRALQKYIIDPLSKEIVMHHFVSGDKVVVSVESNQIIFKK